MLLQIAFTAISILVAEVFLRYKHLCKYKKLATILGVMIDDTCKIFLCVVNRWSYGGIGKRVHEESSG